MNTKCNIGSVDRTRYVLLVDVVNCEDIRKFRVREATLSCSWAEIVFLLLIALKIDPGPPFDVFMLLRRKARYR